ncbi:cell wall shape-determining protein [Candidatus Desulfarcum epimagneticum]|uniref:Peptidoglycan glycosyltransferase RodA n=1 Tax=uncultured Desulfobacteraceae bacterium TaxID=218296 RepID=A0A484HL13_9BACT|nr:cell wall shape-determining protein [uncultured Desulfobacteraceae bacterium]
MFDKRLYQNFDWGIAAVTLLLCVIGAATVYSSVMAAHPSSSGTFFYKQLFWMGIGLPTMTACFLFDYKNLDKWAYFIYAGCVILLVCVPVFGKVVGGARRWLILGPISIQPSEIVKIAIIIVMARYYSKNAETGGVGMRKLVFPMAAILVPFALIIRQPDLGTALLIAIIAASTALFAKIKRGAFLFLSAFFAVSVPVVWFFLKEYQKKRILTFLDPDRDPLNAGYHIIQSKIAIGSGTVWGKGFLEGTQSALSFLPERHTDFIFSVWAEERGFAGSALVLFLFLALILMALNVAYRCRDSFGAILAAGIAIMMFWQVFINIGMVMGLMPVVGVPLPFVSYGGSSTLTMMISVGLLLNISMRRFMFD